MRGAITLVCSISLVGFSGCAGSTAFYGYPTELLRQGNAQMVIHREDAFAGGALTAPIYVNDVLVGKLGPDGRFATSIPIGPVRVRSSAMPISFEAVAGRTYYLEVTLKIEVMRNMVLGVGEHQFEVVLQK